MQNPVQRTRCNMLKLRGKPGPCTQPKRNTAKVSRGGAPPTRGIASPVSFLCTHHALTTIAHLAINRSRCHPRCKAEAHDGSRLRQQARRGGAAAKAV